MTIPKTQSLGPWRLGQNTQFAEVPDAPVYQQRGGRGHTPSLLKAVNVYLDNFGHPQRRLGFNPKFLATDGHELFPWVDGALFRDDDTIFHLTFGDAPTATQVVTGLLPTSRVHFHHHADSVYWTSRTAVGIVDSSVTARNWGAPVAPPPQLSLTSGSLCPGGYQVAMTYVDRFGVEHGAAQAAKIQVGEGEGIQVTHPGSLPPDVSNANVYVTEANGSELSLSAVITSATTLSAGGNTPWSETHLPTQFMEPPILGDGLFSFRGGVLVFRDNFIYSSYGAHTHVFDVTKLVEARPSYIRAGQGVDNGFWTATDGGLFWTAVGDDYASWNTVRRDTRAYAAGSILLDRTQLPAVGEGKDREQIAIFVSEEGLVAGLEDGTAMPLTQDRQHFDVEGMRAHFALHSHRGSEYLFMGWSSY